MTPQLAITPRPAPPSGRILQMILVGTGEPVDLIHVEEDGKGRRYCVQRPCGSQILIDEDQLGCRGFWLN